VEAARTTTDPARFKAGPALKLGQLKPSPASPAPTPAAAAPPAANSSALSHDRIVAIHAAYQKARAETNASAVSLEKLERNIRETEAQLRAKHQGKNIDFEVGVKDGKAILKPRLK
jgi:hypothetical protein